MKKLIWVVGFVAAFAIPTYAQQQSEINLKVTNDELNIIGKGLGKMPFDEVAGLIQKLRQQFIEQQPKQADKPEEKK